MSSMPRPQVKSGFTSFLTDVDTRLENTTKLLDMMRHDFDDTSLPSPKPLLWRGSTTHSERIERRGNSLVRVREGLVHENHTCPAELTITRSLEIEPDYDTLHEEREWQHAMDRLSKNTVECLHVSSRDLVECSGDVKMLRKRSRPVSGLSDSRRSSLNRRTAAPSCTKSSFRGFRQPATPQGGFTSVPRPPSAPAKLHPFRLPIPRVTAGSSSGGSFSRLASRSSTAEFSPRTPTSEGFPQTQTSHTPFSRPTSCPPTSKTDSRLCYDSGAGRHRASRASPCATTLETRPCSPNSEASSRALTAETSSCALTAESPHGQTSKTATRVPISQGALRPSKGSYPLTPRAGSRLDTSEAFCQSTSRASSQLRTSKTAACSTVSTGSRPSHVPSHQTSGTTSRPLTVEANFHVLAKAHSRLLTAETSSRPSAQAASSQRSAPHPAMYAPENHWEVSARPPRGVRARRVAKAGAAADNKRQSRSVPRTRLAYELRPRFAPGRHFIPTSLHLVAMT